jgi:hypothetical protein
LRFSHSQSTRGRSVFDAAAFYVIGHGGYR